MPALEKKWSFGIAGVAALLFSLITPVTTYGEIVELDVGNGITGSAQFIQGSNEAPAILILHGFLQTRDFYTIRRLGTALVDSGYTVLTPTLSLGLDRRKQSLPCEAIHSHSLDSDIKEIEVWVEWLNQKTGRPAVVMGHSAGGVLLAAYLGQRSEAGVSNSILISLAYFGQNPAVNETSADAERAREALASGQNELSNYGLSYCKEYLTTARNFLSYYDWSRERISSALQGITAPVSIVVGSNDHRIDQAWINNIQQNGINVVSIEGANHFFDNEYEFELTDVIEEILSAKK